MLKGADPTTAGDFCRRFSKLDVFALQEAFHEPRLKVWRQQPDAFFDQAIIEADGTMVETTGEKKQGIGMNYKGQWALSQDETAPVSRHAGEHTRGAVPGEPPWQPALA